MLNASKQLAARATLYVLTGKWVQVAGLLFVSAALTGCSILAGTAAGPVEAAIVDGVIAGALAVDWLIASDLMPADMAADLQAWFASTNEGLDLAKQGVADVRANSVTIEQAQYGAGGIIAGLLGLVRAWRGGASKGIVSAAVGALTSAAKAKAPVPTVAAATPE